MYQRNIINGIAVIVSYLNLTIPRSVWDTEKEAALITLLFY